ncbi:hypothetical protein [Flexivirga oryzae]|uniref:Uncharacterized protein n=1 Tax=Flexivirga oryzae TaxID=1794944 RepID=A0A839N0G9_9MICO|nr:hypothetical protein [Flexivirga oryzae]MBB2890867.1 hypothetical protein [Flexivirga oryzae]
MREIAPLVQFTDEELLLLGAEHPAVDTPYLSSLEPAHRQLAAQVAYRSLCSHGAIAVDGGVGLELPESYVTMLRLRAGASSILVVSKATVDAGLMRYHHLGADTIVLEDVSDAGAHLFRLAPRADLRRSLRAFCSVPGAADGSGETITLTEASFTAGASGAQLWGDGLAQFDATVWRAGGAGAAPVLGHLAGTHGSWSVHRPATPQQQVATVELRPIRVDSIADSILGTFVDDEGDDPERPEWHLMRA